MQIKLVTRQLLGTRKYTLSYRINIIIVVITLTITSLLLQVTWYGDSMGNINKENSKYSPLPI